MAAKLPTAANKTLILSGHRAFLVAVLGFSHAELHAQHQATSATRQGP
jgi:hypothetical protein